GVLQKKLLKVERSQEKVGGTCDSDGDRTTLKCCVWNDLRDLHKAFNPGAIVPEGSRPEQKSRPLCRKPNPICTNSDFPAEIPTSSWKPNLLRGNRNFCPAIRSSVQQSNFLPSNPIFCPAIQSSAQQSNLLPSNPIFCPAIQSSVQQSDLLSSN